MGRPKDLFGYMPRYTNTDTSIPERRPGGSLVPQSSNMAARLPWKRPHAACTWEGTTPPWEVGSSLRLLRSTILRREEGFWGLQLDLVVAREPASSNTMTGDAKQIAGLVQDRLTARRLERRHCCHPDYRHSYQILRRQLLFLIDKTKEALS